MGKPDIIFSDEKSINSDKELIKQDIIYGRKPKRVKPNLFSRPSSGEYD